MLAFVTFDLEAIAEELNFLSAFAPQDLSQMNELLSPASTIDNKKLF